MMQAASTLNRRSPSTTVDGEEHVWPKGEPEAIDEAEENCPVICADEIFFGSTGAKSLRVVCYANGIHGRWQRRRVS